MDRSLIRSERIRQRPEFLRVQRHGARVLGRYLTLFIHPNDRMTNRLGIIATRRLGSAVARNRTKRRIREIFRLNKPARTDVGLDVVVLPRPGAAALPMAQLEADYLAAYRRHAVAGA